MRENKIDNLFEEALSKNELLDFILGKREYFVLDRECDEHWALGSYKKYIEPYIAKTDDVFPMTFWKQLIIDFKKYEDKNLLMDFLIAYFTSYYYGSNVALLQERKEKTPSEIILMVKQFIENNKDSLRNDKRGTGAEWNSNIGLLGSMIDNLKIINERGGPNFIPDELI